jgi:hypothetical protein
MKGQPTAPSARRAALKVDVSAELAASISSEGLEQGAIAEACGVDDALVQRWCSKRCLDSISLADLVVLSERYPDVSLQMVRWLCDHLDLEVAPTTGTKNLPMVGLAKLVRSLGAVSNAAVEGEEDGVITPGEASNELQLIREVKKLLPAREAWLVHAIETGGLSTRRTQ